MPERTRWKRWAFAGGVGVLGAAAGALRYAAVRWNTITNEMRGRLKAQTPAATRDVYASGDVSRLPAPVARYLRTVLPEGQRPIAHAHIEWSGDFNMGSPERDRWVPFTAEQDFYPGAPGMVWDARMAMGPGLTVRVRDAFVNGTGSMYGALMGLLPVVDVWGTPAIARGALQRYLAEATWFPTALLPQHGVVWEPVSEHAARATLRVNAIVASVDFRFNADGLVESVFVPDRLYDDGRSEPQPRPWQGRNLSYAVQHGILVPDEAVVEWLLPGRTYQYWRGRPDGIEYEYDLEPPAS